MVDSSIRYPHLLFVSLLCLCILSVAASGVVADNGTEQSDPIAVDAAFEEFWVSTGEDLVVAGSIVSSLEENETVEVSLQADGTVEETIQVQTEPSSETSFQLEWLDEDRAANVSVIVKGSFGTVSHEVGTAVIGEPEITDLEILPNYEQLQEQQTEPAMVEATFASGLTAHVSKQAEIQSTNDSVVWLSGTDFDGFSIHAKEPGSATVVAELQSARDEMDIEVFPHGMQVEFDHHPIPPGLSTAVVVNVSDEGIDSPRFTDEGVYTPDSILSMNFSVVTSEGNEKIRAHQSGTSDLQVKFRGVQLLPSVTVYSSPVELNLSTKRDRMQVGEENQVTVNVTFDDGSTFTVTEPANVSTTDSSVATIENESIIAHEAGTVEIQAEYLGETVSATVEVQNGTGNGDGIPISHEPIFVAFAVFVGLLVSIRRDGH